jgi:hypothetical protein
MLVVRGKAGPVLVDFADQPGDLLVVGCGGRNWLHNCLNGSVTRYCIAHAHCPVLTVPPPELITEMRSRPHRWRPEDFAAPRDTRTIAAPTAEAPRRSATVTSERPTEQPSEESMTRLSAYRGAPYFQPGPPSRKDRTLRRFRLALILSAAMMLIALTGVLLAQSLP